MHNLMANWMYRFRKTTPSWLSILISPSYIRELSLQNPTRIEVQLSLEQLQGQYQIKLLESYRRHTLHQSLYHTINDPSIVFHISMVTLQSWYHRWAGYKLSQLLYCNQWTTDLEEIKCTNVNMATTTTCVFGFKIHMTTTFPWAKLLLNTRKPCSGWGPAALLPYFSLVHPYLNSLLTGIFSALVILTRALDGPRVLGWTAGNRKPPIVSAAPGRLSADALREGSELRLFVIKPGRMGRGGPCSSGIDVTGRCLKCKENTLIFEIAGLKYSRVNFSH